MELLNPLDENAFPGRSIYVDGQTQTESWNAGPQGVLVWVTQPCYIKVGEDARADETCTPIPANTPIPFIVPVTTSGTWAVGAVQMGDPATLYAKPINRR